MSAPAAPAANTTKRDFLIQLEQQAQKRWAEQKVFEANSPFLTGKAPVPTQNFAEAAVEERKKKDKWLGTFPYPYMNGSLHLGHGFTISKIEFGAGFERMLGKEVLWPVGFHCTGMPIKAAADKLIREMEMFGQDFENYESVIAAQEKAKAEEEEKAASADPSKAKKGKLAAKSTGLTYQFQIMESINIPRGDIKKFADPQHWLKHFPPIAQKDITDFGGRVDWRRSFITTPANPYYDSFVRWQMNKLHKLGYIKFGKRYTIYSPKDGQPCMDHDRQSGEGVGPQEYTAIKMPVAEWGPAAKAAGLDTKFAGKKITMVAATLRPETMYGQTNCFVGPSLSYGLFRANSEEEEYYLITPRAARNMAFQSLLKEDGIVNQSIMEIKGKDLIGTKVNAPLSVHQQVYVVPMDTVSATKGTAVVTCVPSDSPDDYITTLELRKKAEFYGIDPAWVSLDVVPVLTTPTYGDLTAKALVEKLKINSPKDTKQLLEAKEICYKEGFYGGTMAIGPTKGMKVEEAKPVVRASLIEEGLAFAYSEPENLVMSRSADECVVALCDQWYLDYGQPEWLAKAELLLSRMKTYQKETRNSFEHTLSWLRQWACARSYGLGSKLPWDPQFLVESLSDSTIYMAYYTIAHLLHGPPVDGSVVGPLGVTAEQMTDEVWEYVFANGALPENSPVSVDAANKLKAEFSYFYPMSIRSSGKDLIPNHLSFCIYVHAALFAPEHWPQSMRGNGHLMLNGEKMSKSTGNSLTLRDALNKFGADATRISLADAGDSIEDANFEETTANAAILRLYTLIEWCKDITENKAQLRSGELTFWDKIFANEINLAIEQTHDAYTKTFYKDALKSGFYSLLITRDIYRDATAQDGGMHLDLVLRWIRVQVLLLTPIASHTAEHIWRELLGETTSIQLALFPVVDKPVDQGVLEAGNYVRNRIKEIRDSEATFAKKKAKGKNASGAFDPTKPKAVKIFVARGFPAWQETAVDIIKASRDAEGKVNDAYIKEELTKAGLIKDKRYMPFIATFKRRLAQLGAEVAFNRSVLFDEKATLEEAMPFIKRQLGISTIDVVIAEEAQESDVGYTESIVAAAEPGSPGIVFYNTDV